jgi:hypothetical protein
MKNLYLVFSLLLVLLGTSSRTTAQCTFGGTQYPSTTFSNPGSTFVTVSGCIYGGEYQLYSVVAGTTYEWSYCTGDGAANAVGEDLQLTAFNNATGASVAYADDVCGVAPKITWVATFTGTVRVLTSLYFCTTNTTCHTLVWRSVSGGGGGTGCNSGVPYLSTTITCPATQFSYASCTYAGEYNTLALTGGTAYTFGSSVTTDYITITNSANTILASGTQPLNFTAPATGSYRVYIHLNSACGTANVCRNPWVTCGGAPPPAGGCNTGVAYSSYTPTCIGSQEPYAGCTFAGEYNTLTLNAGTAYSFGSSITTDFITITNSANTILTSGTQPISFTPPAAGTYRVYIHTNSACGTANTCRNPWVQCGTAPPPIPNDNCAGAIPITPGVYTGTTVGATADIAPACGTAADGTGGGVWYTVTGTAPCQTYTASLCTGTTFDSQIRVFSGTCTGLTCVAGSDDFCGAQSEVTWTATQGTTYYILVHGFNIATGPFSLNLTQSTSSTITPAVATLPTVTAECQTTLTAPTATSSCTGALTGVASGSTTFSSQGTFNVTWTYSDGVSTSTQTQSVVIDDNTAPVPSVASLTPVNSTCTVNSINPPTATDNCGGSIVGTTSTTFPLSSSALVTWSFDDGNGNISTQTQQVTVSDLQAPVPSQASLSTVVSNCSPVASLTAPTATDNCSGSITGTTTTSFPIASTTSVVWTYVDGSGNTSTQNQLVVVGDSDAPVPNIQTLSAVNSTCPISSLTPPTANDNCAGTVTATTSATFPINTSTSVTWTYSDGNGNTTTQQQNVIISDVTAPVPNTASLSAISSSCTSVTSLTAPSATDNCSGSVTGTTTTSLPITQSTTVVWTFTDAAGNTSTQNQSVVIGDNTAPVADVSNLSPVSSTCPIASLTPPTATDNCSGAVTGTTTTNFPIASNTTVTWTFTDATGNTSTQTQSVVISDVTPPVPSFPNLNTVTSTCNPVSSLAVPTANDNCSGVITGTTTTTFPITQSTTVVWTFTDAAGNSTTQNQNVVIGDNTAPVPDAASLSTLTSSCSITTLTPPTATDNCSGLINGTTTNTLPITATTAVTWTFTDAAGNSSTQTQNIVVNDAVAPVPNAAQLATLNESCSLASITPPTATDNCSGLITGTTTTSFPITQSTNVTWTFTDGSGNTATQVQSVVISDVIAPIPDLSNLSDVTSACDVTSLVPPTATDNCSGLISATTSTALPISTTTVVTWTYTDGSGNSVTQTQNVIVNDNIAPTPVISALQDINSACAVSSLNAPTATDNCNGTITGTTTTVLPIGVTTVVTWTYDDGNGNITTQTQNVVVSNNAPPTPDVQILSDVNAVCEITSLTPPTANDGCGNTITGISDANLPLTSTTTVTWTFTAQNGGVSTQTQQVNISPLDASTTLSGGTLSVNSPQNGAIYQWIDCSTGNAIAGASSETFTPTVSGAYAVEVSFGSCFEVSDCSDVTVTNSILDGNIGAIKMYPNPTFNELWFNLNNEATIIIRDMNGKQLLTKVLAEGNQLIEVGELATGMYHVQVETKYGSKILQLVKQ